MAVMLYDKMHARKVKSEGPWLTFVHASIAVGEKQQAGGLAKQPGEISMAT